MLIPQIAQEALAKGIIESVKALSRRSTLIKAKIILPEARDPSHLSLPLYRLPTVAIDDQFVAVQENFLGNELAVLIRQDILRFSVSEKMTPITRDSSNLGIDKPTMAWIDPGEKMQENYPALSELIEQLHLLPYELNRKFLCNNMIS